MEDFVPTRCAQVKKNVKDDFVSVTFTAHKKKIRKDEHVFGEQSDEVEKLSPEEQKQKQEKEMKRLRWDIMKFGASGMKAGKKQSAKTALILQLGGIPTKSKKNQNYKEILQRKTKEKARQERRCLIISVKGLSMGQSQSARKLTINNEDSVIQISTDLADRLATRSKKPVANTGSVSAPPPTPTPVSSPANVPNEGYSGVATYPEYTITAYKMQQQKELELAAQDQYWQKRLAHMKLTHEKINRVFQDEYKRAMDEVESARGNKNVNLDTMTPACGADKEKVLQCYQQNPKEILKCSSLVEEFNHCVDQRRSGLISAKC